MLQSFSLRLTEQPDHDQFLRILAFEGECDSQVCGRIFSAGDVIYHCNTCAYDESCVFCKDCFVHDQHEGHAVTFSQSSGNGRCCDCENPESWKTLECVPYPVLIRQKRALVLWRSCHRCFHCLKMS